MSKNANLNKAKKEKNDEFYTQLTDIEKELKHYKHHFKDKIVFCNCDDPEWSEFYNYFHLNFEELGLKKLICTHYDKEKPTYKLEIEGDVNGDGKIDGSDVVKTRLLQNGDFRSEECIELLKECDIVVTNPPFSLFREYVAQLMEYNKKFLIIGNKNAVSNKDFFPLLKDNKVWIGYGKPPKFLQPDGTYKNMTGLCWWFTNLDIDKRHQDIILWKTYKGNEQDYPKYDNYDAIEVSKVDEIPIDYVPCWFNCPYTDNCPFAKSKGDIDFGLCDLKNAGEMGVPVTFFDKYSPEQFEIIDSSLNLGKPMSEIDPTGIYEKGGPAFYLKERTDSNGNIYIYIYRRLYTRIVIRRKM